MFHLKIFVSYDLQSLQFFCYYHQSMDIQRKALFNLLRMNWLLEPVIDVVDWQVEDYRALTLGQLFQRLEKEEIRLDSHSFVAHAEQFDSPEAFTDSLVAEDGGDAAVEDRIYLLIFELWRRLLPERSTLSIFCDELDHQIGLYDADKLGEFESLEDALANLQAILDENCDLGNEPHEVFRTVCEACANDLEEFLYDFIAEQIDAGNEPYATELLDGFYGYVSDIKWFDLLRARVLAPTDLAAANQLVRKIVADTGDDKDLIFNLEVLSYMVQGGERETFIELVQKSFPAIAREGELSDLLAICAEFYQRLDYEDEETALHTILEKRGGLHQGGAVKPDDPVFGEWMEILTRRPI